MKKILVTLNLIALGALVSAGGFYLGSRGEKVEILLPPLVRNESGETGDSAPEVRADGAVPSSKDKGSEATAASQGSTVVPAAPEPAQAPEPQTSVS